MTDNQQHETLNIEAQIPLKKERWPVEKLERLYRVDRVSGDLFSNEQRNKVKALLESTQNEAMALVNLREEFFRPVTSSRGMYIQAIQEDHHSAWMWESVDLKTSELADAMNDNSDLEASQKVKKYISKQIKDDLPKLAPHYYVFCLSNGIDPSFGVGRRAEVHVIEHFIKRVISDMEGYVDMMRSEHHEQEYFRKHQREVEEELAQEEYGRSMEDLTEDQRRSIEESAMHETLERATQSLYEDEEYEDRLENYREDAKEETIKKWMNVIEELQEDYDKDFRLLAEALMVVAAEHGTKEFEVAETLGIDEDNELELAQRGWKKVDRTF